MAELCKNRTPITGQCVIGCGGFGYCQQGHERPLPARDLVNPLTGRLYSEATRALQSEERDTNG